MTDIIKNRIKTINKGELPEGYQRTRAGIMPVDWDGTVRAKQLFRSYTDKMHNGDLAILASTQESGIVPRSLIGIDIQCSDEGVKGYKKVSKGDFVISLRSFQGGIEYSEYDGIVSPAYTVLKLVKDISADFYRNYFKTAPFINRLNGAVYGIRDGKQIGYEDFGDLYVHCPPLAEQECIADILNQCDKVIALKKERLEEERKKKKWLIEKLLSSGTPIDLNKCCSSGGEYGLNAPACEYRSDLPKYIRITDIDDNGKYRSETPVSVNADEFTKYMLCEGDILFVRTGATVGKAYHYSRTDGELVFAGFLIRFSVNRDCYDDRFIYYQFLTSRYRDWVLSMSARSGQPGINANEYGKYQVLIPATFQRQKKVADVLSAEDTLIEQLEKELVQWIAKKKALMQLLLSGIIRVRA